MANLAPLIVDLRWSIYVICHLATLFSNYCILQQFQFANVRGISISICESPLSYISISVTFWHLHYHTESIPTFNILIMIVFDRPCWTCGLRWTWQWSRRWPLSLPSALCVRPIGWPGNSSRCHWGQTGWSDGAHGAGTRSAAAGVWGSASQTPSRLGCAHTHLQAGGSRGHIY